MKRNLVSSILFIVAAWTFAKVQREHLEMLRDEMTASCWRGWYATHGVGVVPEMREWNGRTIPAGCEVP